MLRNGFRGEVPEHDLEATVATFRATVEGAYAQGRSRAKRRKVLSFALERLWDRDRARCPTSLIRKRICSIESHTKFP
jgi:hypothetical protein